MAKEILTLRVAEILPDPNQPRKEFDQAELKELADSIVAEGQLTPINVAKLSEDHSGRPFGKNYGLICGERRLRAHQLAGLETILAVVEEFQLDDKAIYRKQLLENAVRQDLKPVEFAFACKHGVEEMGMSLEEIAAAMGKSPATIAKSISLCKLPSEVQKALNRGEIPKAVAERIAELPDGQMLSAFSAALKKPKNVEDMKAAINAYLTNANQAKIPLQKSEDAKAKELELANKFYRWRNATDKLVGEFTAHAEALANGRGNGNADIDKIFWESITKMAATCHKAVVEKIALRDHRKAVKDETPAEEPKVVNG